MIMRRSIAALLLVLLLCSCSGETRSFPSEQSTDYTTEIPTEVKEIEGSEELLEPTQTTATEAKAGTPEGMEMNFISDGENMVTIRIQNILQNEIGMPNGCEAVSLAMVLKYYGYEIQPKKLFLSYMPKGKYGTHNPFYYYIGDACNYSGYGCYAPCIVRCANDYLEQIGSAKRAFDVSGSTMEELEAYLIEGTPVILWGTLGMEYSDVLCTWYFGRNSVNWYSASHCVVLRGMRKDLYEVCDPMAGKVFYSKDKVEAAYNCVYTQAVIIK